MPKRRGFSSEEKKRVDEKFVRNDTVSVRILVYHFSHTSLVNNHPSLF